jgi:hypothetical protein
MCITWEAMQVINTIGNKYVMEGIAYIQVFGVTKLPHVFPKFILDKLEIQEIAYQSYLHVFGSSISKDKKYSWPTLPLHIGSYGLNDTKCAKVEGEYLVPYRFRGERFRRHIL